MTALRVSFKEGTIFKTKSAERSLMEKERRKGKNERRSQLWFKVNLAHNKEQERRLVIIAEDRSDNKQVLMYIQQKEDERKLFVAERGQVQDKRKRVKGEVNLTMNEKKDLVKELDRKLSELRQTLDEIDEDIAEEKREQAERRELRARQIEPPPHLDVYRQTMDEIDKSMTEEDRKWLERAKFKAELRAKRQCDYSEDTTKEGNKKRKTAMKE